MRILSAATGQTAGDRRGVSPEPLVVAARPGGQKLAIRAGAKWNRTPIRPASRLGVEIEQRRAPPGKPWLAVHGRPRAERVLYQLGRVEPHVSAAAPQRVADALAAGYGVAPGVPQ